MSKAQLLHPCFIILLLSMALLAWRVRGRFGWLALCGLASVTLFVGWRTVDAAFATRGTLWQGEPLRSFKFDLTPSPDTPLGAHHKIVEPKLPADRLPEAFDDLRGPIHLTLQFELLPDGSVRAPRLLDSSGHTDVDAATLETIGRYRFGALPETFANPRAETVKLTITNRYSIAPAARRAFLFLALYLLLWTASVLLLPRHIAPGQKVRQELVAKILFAGGFLAAFSVLLVYRLSADLGRLELLNKQSGFAIGGLVVLWMAAKWSARPSFLEWLRRGPAILVIGGFLLLLITRFTPLGTDNNTGHRQWLRTPLGAFQTIEFVKLLLIGFVAATAPGAMNIGALSAGKISSKAGETVVQIRTWGQRYHGIIGGFGLICLALILMKDFGPLLLLIALLIGLLYLQGQASPAGRGAVMVLAILLIGYAIGWPGRWVDRVQIWHNPWQGAASDNIEVRNGREHMARVLWAQDSGGWWGDGLAQGRADEIEAVESDFIYAAIAEECGFLGSVAVLGVLWLLALSGLRLALCHQGVMTRLLIGGLSLLFALQAALTIGGSMALWPITGITLPLVSYGGSSLLVSFFALGILIGQAGRNEENNFTQERIQQGQRALQWTLAFSAALFAVLFIGHWWPARYDAAHLAYHDAHGDILQNSRFDAKGNWVQTHMARGAIIDRNGEILAHTTQRGRIYAGVDEFAPLLGFDNGAARVGLERTLDDALMGHWHAAPTKTLLPHLPHLVNEWRGYDVNLTIDAHLQEKAYRLLESNDYRGSIVAMKPNGEILCAASYPPPATLDAKEWIASYDGRADAAPSPLRRAYEPGSIFKTVTAAAALESHTIRRGDTFQCDGLYRALGGGVIPDQGHTAHGRINLATAMAVSCNNTFAKIGAETGWNHTWDFMQRASLTHSWNLVPPEMQTTSEASSFKSASGQLLHHNQAPSQAPREDREIVKLAQSAIGQHDVRLSALHMAAWTATIANGGHLSVPRLINGVTDPQTNQKTKFAFPPTRRIISERTAHDLREMMEGVVNNGTGKPARVRGLHIGGKTGTPETGVSSAESNHAIFIAFGGVNQPQVAVAVVIEEHRGGGKTAGPLAAEIIQFACR